MKRGLCLIITMLIVGATLLLGCGESGQEGTTVAPGAPSGQTTVSAGATSATSGQTETTGGSAEKPDKVIKLTMANFFPPTNYHSVLVEQWIAEIEKRTNGGVDIEYFPGSALVAADKTYESVTGGMADMAMSVVSYSMGRFPAMELLDQPYGHVSPWVSSVVAQEFFDKYQPAEFDDAHVFYFHANNLSHALIAKKPVRKLADMKGMIIRSSGVGVQVAGALGATGYAGTMAEGYELLSKNVVDASISGLDALTGWKQAEVVSYLTPLGPCTHSAVIYSIMNKDVWESLPDNYKAVFTEVSAEMPGRHGMVWQYYDKTAVDYLLTLPGRELIEIPADDIPAWQTVASGIIEKFKADKQKLGLPEDDYLAFLKDRTDTLRAQAPTDDDCVKWVEAELKK